MSKSIAILGATGSVGMQAQQVALSRGYKVDFMSANTDVDGMENAARRFMPSAVCMADEEAASELRVRLADTSVKVLAGEEGVVEGTMNGRHDTVVNAIIGKAGLYPTLAAIEAGHRLALANKESLVIAGDIVMRRAKEKGTEIIPVDSEHSAIFQSLHAGSRREIKKIILTASGGPFFGMSRGELLSVTVEDTLAHPTWRMGKRITVDSATLMNKGFEIIEASHLFGVPAEKIEVVIHRESILHSAVEYIDNALIGEFSAPDMCMCVQYAIDYPDRFISDTAELNLFDIGALTFKRPDESAFPLLSVAKRAMIDGGAMAAVLNAADEVAVSAFLSGRLPFLGISEAIEATYQAMSEARTLTALDDIMLADAEAREITRSYIN